VSGQRYDFDQNEDGIRAIQLDFDGPDVLMTLHDARGEHKIACGYQQWPTSQTHLEKPFHELDPHMAAASGAWSAEDTYTMQLAFIETPFISTLTFRFEADQLEFRKRV